MKRNCKSWFRKFLIPPHPLTNFEIQNYYENESRFNGVFSRDNLPKEIKDVAYKNIMKMNLDLMVFSQAIIYLKK